MKIGNLSFGEWESFIPSTNYNIICLCGHFSKKVFFNGEEYCTIDVYSFGRDEWLISFGSIVVIDLFEKVIGQIYTYNYYSADEAKNFVDSTLETASRFKAFL